MSSSEPLRLAVVIVAFRCEAMLRDCLLSLREHSPARPMTVHVVDNDSGDGTAEMVGREFPEVILRRNAANLGFGAANNLAIAADSSPQVLFLNPDTRITAGALDLLCGLLDERPELAMVGPRLIREDGSFDHAAKRSFPTVLGSIGHFTGAGQRSGASGALAQYRAPDLDEHQSGLVDAVNGAFMLVRRRALDDVGLFDEGYWMYMEDLDLNYRLAEAGWKTWYEAGATVVHLKAGTSGPVRSLKLNRAFHYGMLRFYRKHYASSRNPIVNTVVYLGIGLKFVASAALAVIRRRQTS